MIKQALATVVALAGVLAVSAPAHAGTFVGNPDRHAASVIESIGTKYTMSFSLPEVDDEVLVSSLRRDVRP